VIVIESYSALKKVSFFIPDLARDPAGLQRFPLDSGSPLRCAE